MKSEQSQCESIHLEEQRDASDQKLNRFRGEEKKFYHSTCDASPLPLRWDEELIVDEWRDDLG